MRLAIRALALALVLALVLLLVAFRQCWSSAALEITPFVTPPLLFRWLGMVLGTGNTCGASRLLRRLRCMPEAAAAAAIQLRCMPETARMALRILPPLLLVMMLIGTVSGVRWNHGDPAAAPTSAPYFM
jgi:hypothetical protein